jgi:membrane protease YdiL (CAAX protease family)
LEKVRILRKKKTTSDVRRRNCRTRLIVEGYHVPYAYVKPSWPSAGDLPGAIRLAFTNGAIGGLALGFVYWRSGGNLVVAIGLHALIDLIPATRLMARMLGVT